MQARIVPSMMLAASMRMQSWISRFGAPAMGFFQTLFVKPHNTYAHKQRRLLQRKLYKKYLGLRKRLHKTLL